MAKQRIEYKSEEVVSYLGIRNVEERNYSVEWMMAKGPSVGDSASIVLARPLDDETVITYVGGTRLNLPKASVVS